MKWMVGVLAGAVLLMTGCSGGGAKTGPIPTPTVLASPVPVTAAPTPTAPATPTADPAIMATMTCEPANEELLSTLQFGPTPTRSVQVEVGEGLEPGSRWWIVVIDLPDDPYHGWPPHLRRFLTDAPGIPLDHRPGRLTGTWLEIDQRSPGQDFQEVNPGAPWANVKWDSQRLTRAMSALAKAEECLVSS